MNTIDIQYFDAPCGKLILVPCQRVIGSDDTLTGYGGGTDIKRFLLQLEQKMLFPR